VAKDPSDSTRRLLLPLKNNLGPDGKGLAFRLTDGLGSSVPIVSWDPEPVTIKPAEVLGLEVSGQDASERAFAAEWLREALAGGPVPAKDLFQQARENGIAETTLRRAAKELGIKPIKSGFSGGWTWPQWPGSREAGQDNEDGRTEKVTIFADGDYLRAPKGPCRQEDVNAN